MLPACHHLSQTFLHSHTHLFCLFPEISTPYLFGNCPSRGDLKGAWARYVYCGLNATFGPAARVLYVTLRLPDRLAGQVRLPFLFAGNYMQQATVFPPLWPGHHTPTVWLMWQILMAHVCDRM